MFGWFRAEADRASFSNRLTRDASSDISGESTLTATSRPSRSSFARYTSPIPPAPRGDRISYGPRRVPFLSVTGPGRSVGENAGTPSIAGDSRKLEGAAL